MAVTMTIRRIPAIPAVLTILFACGVLRGEEKFFRGDNGAFAMTLRGERIPGRFTVRDGESGKVLALQGRVSGETLTLAGDGIELTLSQKPAYRLFRVDGKVRNTSGRERRLELAATLLCRRQAQDRFYEGFNVLPAGNAPLARLGVKGKSSKHIGGGLNPPFPVAGLFNGERAIFAGHQIFAPVSYNAATYRPLADGRSEITFAQRLVPGKGQTLDFDFVLGALPVKFGAEENIVQSFYDAFPERFRPFVPITHWLLRGAHSHYRAYIGTPDPERERRYYASIEWAYAPFKRSGDPYCNDRYWDYTPLIKPRRPIEFNMRVNGKVLNYNQMTAQEYRAARQKVFQKWGERLGYAFYMCPAWCEINLAKQYYPDAVNYDTSGDVKHIINGWVQEHDREVRVFPMSTTSLGKALREDLKKIHREVQNAAFTTDCGAPGAYYRGPAVNNPDSPGRAWDDKGLFIDELVAANEVIDFVHKLDPADPVVLWKNGPGAGDMMMIETSIFRPDFRSWMPLTRYNIGMRPAVIHAREGYMVNDTIPNWRKLNREEFYREFTKLGDHVVLTGFRYGLTQSDRCFNGNPMLAYAMPELLELVKLGWQPLFPVAYDSGNRFLYRARYGTGADTVLYFGNPWEQPMRLAPSVDNRELGAKNVAATLFVRKMRDRAVLDNRVTGGNTVFTAELPVRRPALFEAVCTLDKLPGDGVFAARVEAEKDLNKIRFGIRVTEAKPFAAQITARRIAGFRPGRIFAEGKEVTGPPLRLATGKSFEIRYESEFFKCGRADILSFPFTDRDKVPRFTLELPGKSRKYELREARSLADYFRFTAEKKITRAPVIAFSRAPQVLSGPRIVIARGGGSGISRRGDLLELRAGDMKQLRAMREKLQFVMDEKYPYIFPFTSMGEFLPGEIVKKFDMEKRPLPYDRCFETGGAR